MAAKSSSTAETPPSEGALTVRERVRTYVVVGNSAQQIADVLRINGPKHAGERHAAYSHWTLSWRLARSHSVAGCAEITLDLLTTMPQWIALRGARDELCRAWADYLAALQAHEAGHRQIALQAANAARAALSTYNGSRFDDRLELSARTAVDAIVEDARIEDARYDRETRHGAVDPRIGAIFHPLPSGELS